MGWLLTLWLSLPPLAGAVEIRMWFSRESYCTFAEDKFRENPMRRVLPGGGEGAAEVARSECRALRPGEAHLIPEHMRGGYGGAESGTQNYN